MPATSSTELERAVEHYPPLPPHGTFVSENLHVKEEHAQRLYQTPDLDLRVSTVSKQPDPDELLIDLPQSTQLTPLPLSTYNAARFTYEIEHCG